MENQKLDTKCPSCGSPKENSKSRRVYCKTCDAAYRRSRRLLNFFLLTPEEADKIAVYQGGVCAICKKPPLDGRRLALDHRHKDGLVRGALCNWCNRAIARFGDSIVLLRSAADYLEKPPACKALGKEHYARPGRIGTKKMRAAVAKEKRKAKLDEFLRKVVSC